MLSRPLIIGMLVALLAGGVWAHSADAVTMNTSTTATPSPPAETAVTSRYRGQLDMFARGADNALWHRSWSGSWGGWVRLGGVLTSAPAAASWGGDHIGVFATGTDGGTWHRQWDGTWRPWETVPDSSPGRLDALHGRTNTPNTSLSLRSCASTTCTILSQIPHDTVLSLTGTSGDWFKTSYGGAGGWVSSWYVVLQGTAAATVTRGSASRRMVSYTFDAGADLGFAGPILDFLRDNGIPASFGMTGRWAATNPAYVRRMANEGHHLINHSWSHDSFTGYSTGRGALSPARRTEELVSTKNQILSLTGRNTQPYFRPPYGDYDSTVTRDIGANGYSRNVLWNIDSAGWRGLNATDICNRVVGAVDADAYRGNGSIVVFHVGSQSQDVYALSCITSNLRARGFGFGTVPQVLAP